VTKQNKKLIGLVLLIVITGLVLFLIKPECVFKKLLGIRCPACGITRALELAFQGKIIEAFTYNILTPLLLITSILVIIMIIIDITKNQNNLEKATNFLIQHYWIIIILLIISMLINNIRKI